MRTMNDFPEGYFYIQSRESGKVIDVDGASMKNDGKILIWTPKHNDDRDNQLWYYQDGFLINKHSGKVLDVRGGPLVENAWIIQYDRKIIADAHNQRWGYKDGYIYSLAEPHLVLDIKGNSMEDGTRLILYRKKMAFHNANQLWDLVPAGDVRGERDVLFEADFD
ncbi:ricin B lectin domain-containing protein [Radiomyces spectabilis]|uniref:ricin B lectin domain-containing protein n=1 Tax=Radiomyces spectabilis TaxID=64574 RepID=UPI0022212424|nr:ricin B lectin domain-containing protein [Radiomyces spectabilis]KAI8393868.1 ricin B lectin domain-containing protein [Radiomyces spectabilis]